MIRSVIRAAFQLPAIRSFMDNILVQLEDGVSGLILLPETAPHAEFETELRTQLVVRNSFFLENNLSHESTRFTPITCLCQKLDITWPDSMTLQLAEYMFENCEFPEIMPDIVLLTGLEGLSSEMRRDWLETLSDWADVGKRLRNRGNHLPAICMVLSAKACPIVPSGDILFKVYYWWGIPSVLEMRLLCVAGNGYAADVDRWREYILPHICAGDLQTLVQLLDCNITDQHDVEHVLKTIADEREWTTEFLELRGLKKFIKADPLIHSTKTNAPEGLLFLLWSEGIVNQVRELGLAISSPALYAIGNRTDINHRFWCGQVELMFPMLNMLRLALCEYMDRHFGKNWPTEHATPVDPLEASQLQQDSSHCQLGHLETVLQRWPGRQKPLKQLLPGIKEARLLRNHLAHNRPVTLADYEKLCEIANQAQGLMASGVWYRL